MTNDAEISMEFSPVKSFKDFMYNTLTGRGIMAMGIGGALYIGYQMVDNYLIKGPEPVVQQQVFGTNKPEIYIERNGVKYFSYVDGREISDLVNP